MEITAATGIADHSAVAVVIVAAAEAAEVSVAVVAAEETLAVEVAAEDHGEKETIRQL